MRKVTANGDSGRGLPGPGNLQLALQFRNEDPQARSVHGPAARALAGVSLAEHEGQSDEDD